MSVIVTTFILAQAIKLCFPGCLADVYYLSVIVDFELTTRPMYSTFPSFSTLG